jgi:hypothetical protein
MYQESLFSCQAWQAATNSTFKFGNAPGEKRVQAALRRGIWKNRSVLSFAA